MSHEQLSHFAEKSGIIPCATSWGRWWQTVQEIHLEVDLPPGTKARQVMLKVTPNHIHCNVANEDIFMGRLFSTVHADETVWTVEDNKILSIVLSKADHSLKEKMWEALLEGGGFQPDMLTLHEMRKKLDLEKFQIENPGFDFSRAKLSKGYDRLPGWSEKRLQEKAAKPENQET